MTTNLIQSVTTDGTPVGEPTRSEYPEIVATDDCCINVNLFGGEELLGACQLKSEDLGVQLYYDEETEICGQF